MTSRQTLAQMDLSGNSFGNKGWFVILTFRKYRGEYTHTRQKALIAGREISVGRPTDLGRHTAESAWIALARRAWAHAVGWAAAAHHGGWRWSSSPALANGCARQVRAAQSLNLHGHTDSMCDRERQTVACFCTGGHEDCRGQREMIVSEPFGNRCPRAISPPSDACPVRVRR